MPWENSWIRFVKNEAREQGLAEGIDEGRQKGLQQGLELGLLKGHREAVMHLLQLRYGPVPEAAAGRIAQASTKELEAYAAAILRLQTLEEVFAQR